MKFILQNLEHSLLLFLPIKTKQPPIVPRPPNLIDGQQPQDEEEFFYAKISKILSNQLIIKPHL